MSSTIELQTMPAPQLGDLIKEATENGEITLTDGGNVVAKIVAVQSVLSGRRKRRAGSAKAWLKVPDDFKAPLEEFKDYM